MPLPEDLQTVVNLDLAYPNPDNAHRFRIVTENPVLGFEYLQWNPAQGQTSQNGSLKRVSADAIKTVCDLLNSWQAVHVDTALHSGGNSRSVLEAALANTANVWVKYINGRKHTIYTPTASHAIGQIGYE